MDPRKKPAPFIGTNPQLSLTIKHDKLHLEVQPSPGETDESRHASEPFRYLRSGRIAVDHSVRAFITPRGLLTCKYGMLLRRSTLAR